MFGSRLKIQSQKLYCDQRKFPCSADRLPSVSVAQKCFHASWVSPAGEADKLGRLIACFMRARLGVCTDALGIADREDAACV